MLLKKFLDVSIRAAKAIPEETMKAFQRNWLKPITQSQILNFWILKKLPKMFRNVNSKKKSLMSLITNFQKFFQWQCQESSQGNFWRSHPRSLGRCIKKSKGNCWNFDLFLTEVGFTKVKCYKVEVSTSVKPSSISYQWKIQLPTAFCL